MDCGHDYLPQRARSSAGSGAPWETATKKGGCCWRLIGAAGSKSCCLGATIGAMSCSWISASPVGTPACISEMGTWILQDLESTNGTVVNGVAVGRCELRPGDRVVVGSERLLID